MVRRSGWLSTTLRYLLAICVAAVMAFPLLWMFRVSLLGAGSIEFERLIGGGITIANFVDLFRDANMGRYLFNSILVGVIVTAGNILFCFMSGYALARWRTAVSRLILMSVIGVLMIPAHIVIIPLYMLMIKTGMYDSYFALTLPFLVNPIGIFLVKQYVEGIPTSMEEAARLDGAGQLRIVFQVMMPLCKPALAVLAIQVFFTNWNAFLFPFILTSRDTLRTLPVGLALLQGHQAIDWQHLMAGSAVAVVPVLILFVVLQRQIVSGITAGAIKQ